MPGRAGQEILWPTRSRRSSDSDRARETRPDETLGVIAMGIKHANRIEEALGWALVDMTSSMDF